MKKTIITLAAGILATIAIAGPADAADRAPGAVGVAYVGSDGATLFAHNPWSEATTREADGIPSSVKHIKGTAFWVEDDIRCFQGLATERVLIQGQPVRAGRNVGYCTDGYVDRSKGESMTRFVVINPGR